MKKLIFIFVVFTFNILNAQYYSYTNIKNLPQNEYFTYKGISSKKDKAIIIYTETSIDKSYWNIKETYIRGNVTNNLKDPFKLKENFLTNVRKSETYSTIDLKNMRTVYAKSIDYYEFGNIEYTFDIRKKVDYTNNAGSLAIFSMYGIYQIARAYPIGSTNQMSIIMPTSSPDSKLRAYVIYNGIKKIDINNNQKNAYEMEVKIEGIHFSIFLPKMGAYIEENDDSRKIIKYNSITGMFDNIDIYLTDYKSK